MSVAGRMTRDFIARYADGRRVKSALQSHFHMRTWHAKASVRYRKLRDEAREWLVEEINSTVIRWVEDYIEDLTHSIEGSEIDEERRF